MADANTVKITLKAVADMGDVVNNVKQIQDALSKLNIPDGLKGKFNKLFSDVEKNAEKASDIMSKGFDSKSNVTAYSKAVDNVSLAFKKIVENLDSVDFSKMDWKPNTKEYAEAADKVKQLKKEIDDINANNLKEVEKVLSSGDKGKAPSGAKAWGDFFAEISKGTEGIDEAEKALARLQAQVTKYAQANPDQSQWSENWKAYAQGVEVYDKALKDLKGETGPTVEKTKELQEALEEISNLEIKEIEDAAKNVEDLKNQAGQAVPKVKDLGDNLKDSAQSSGELKQQLDGFKDKVKYFFGLENGINLFKQAVKSAYETVKDLDAVMTETAVVTDFDVGDMWEQLPEYSKRASELGVSIHDAYEASTIFYQQGLKTNEVMALSNETMKMARIAGLDAATASDRMTNALRGFNMELNETNAQRVNDVYSKLAAITAADTDEISTAMTKVASLAHNANMEFETTSAFLAQMVETTRESAETAGTALKTIIARFSEVKKLYSQGDLMGTDEEGEAIDVNKVSGALRTAGIDMNEYFTGAKGLDDIFMELAQKWDSLDQVQQRYIATMAAGSRQQSRFIAMMSDYQRTTELVGAANNSAGAAQEQYGKTLESLQTKLTNLKNAWDAFIMGLSNNEFIKTGVDILTSLLTTINNLIDAISGGSGLIKSVETIGITFGAFKIGKSVFAKMFDNFGPSILGILKGEANKIKSESKVFEDSGRVIADKIRSGFTKGFGKGGIWDSLKSDGFKGILDSLKIPDTVSVKELGLDPETLIDIKDLDFTSVADDIKDSLLDALKDSAFNDISDQIEEDTELFDELTEVFASARETGDLEELNERLEAMGINCQLTAEQAEELGINVDNSSEKINKMGAACAGIGSILLMVSEKIDTTSTAGKVFSDVLKAVGIALMAMPVVLKVLDVAFKAFGKSVTTTIMGIPIIGWVIGIITVLTTLIAAIVSFSKANSAKEKLKEAEEAASNAAEAANAAAEAYDNLNESLSNLDANYNSLENMTKGTEEWRKKVEEINSEILELMDNYGDLGNIVIDEDGVLHFEDPDAAKKAYKERVINTQSADIGARIQKIKSKGELEYDKLRTKFTREGYPEVISKVANGGLDSFSEEEKSFVRNEYDPEFYNILKEYDKTITEGEAQLDSAYTSLSANALQHAELSENKYAQNYLSPDKMKERFEIEEQNTEKLDYDEAGGKYEEYWKDVYGDNIEINNKGTITGKNRKGEDIKIDAESAKAQYSAAKAEENAADSVKIFTKELEKADYVTKKFYSEKEGGAFRKEDLDMLKAAKVTKDGRIITGVKEYAEFVWDGFSEEMKEALGGDKGKNAFIQEYIDAESKATDAYKKGTNIINSIFKQDNETNDLANELANDYEEMVSEYNLSSSAAKSLAEGMQQITIQGGNANEVMNVLQDTLANIDEDKQDAAANIISKIDWYSSDAIDNAMDQLKSLGVVIDKDLTKKLYSLSATAKKVDLTKVEQQLTNLESVKKSIESSDSNSFKKEDFEAMMQAGVDRSDFVRTSVDEWTYIGGTTNDLLSDIDSKTGEILENTRKDLQGAIAKGTVIEDLINSGGKLTGKGENGKSAATYDIKEAIERISNGSLAVGERDLTNGEVGSISQEDAIFLAESMGIANANVMGNDQLAAAIKNAFETYYVPLGEYRQEQEIYEKDQKDIEIASSKSYQEAAAKGGTEEQLQGYVSSSAQKLGIGNNELQEYTNKIIENNKALENNKSLAMEIAKDNILMNQGLTELASNWENISKALRTENRDTPEYSQALTTLKSSMQKVLGISVNLSDEFYTNAENMELMRRAANGDTEAVAELRAAAAKEIIAKAEIKLDEESTNNVYNLLDSMAAEDIEIGASLKESQFADSLYNILEAACASVEDIENAFNSIGWEPDIEYKEVPFSEAQSFSGKTEQEILVPRGVDENGVTKYEKTTIGAAQKAGVDGETMVRIPIINGAAASYKEALFAGTKFRGTTKDTVSPTVRSPDKGGGGSKGGGSKEKPARWENPYDELYNLNEKINESVRKRAELERKYQKLIDAEKTSLKDVRNSYNEQIKALKSEIDLQKQLQAGKLKQINNIANETYTDKDGNVKTFKQMGVTGYAKYDKKTGTIQINYPAMEALAKKTGDAAEDKGKAVEAYVSKLEELVSGYEEVRDAIWEIEDTIEDMQREMVESYLSFEDRVKEAVISDRQDFIDQMQSVSDALDEANGKVIENLRESIDLSRQIRDNTKTEEDIADKEQRLAYLNRDTSGANQTEILQLQKEIDDARQSYSDTLIDQAITKLEDENNLAAEQRAKQIEIAQAQLDLEQKNGDVWNTVSGLINGAIGDDGNLNVNSVLVTKLAESEEFTSLSNLGQKKWWAELQDEYAKAMIGKGVSDQLYTDVRSIQQILSNVYADEIAKAKAAADAMTKKTDTKPAANNTKPAANNTQSTTSNTQTAASNTQSKNSTSYTELQKYGVAAAIGRDSKGSGWGDGETRKKRLQSKGFNYDEIQKIINELISWYPFNHGGWEGTEKVKGLRASDLKKYYYSKFKTGGLADFTGPAWLDGSKSRPELVLSAIDTQNFIALKEVLAQLLKNNQLNRSAQNTGGDNYFDINIQADINSDYDVDQLANRIKKQIVDDATYRNVTSINWIR